jgi:mono/diheme cytochrome c family protein
MSRSWMLGTGLALLIAGSLGLATTIAVGAAYQDARNTPVNSPARTITPAPSAVAVGQGIYVNGIGIDGPIANSGGPIWFQRMGTGCAVCHGADGRGRVIRMMGETTDAPDIRYLTLTEVGSVEPSASVGPWTDGQIVRAVREGFEPDGTQLNSQMPRWTLTDAEARDLIDYLKELK